MICTECATPAAPGARFCSRCGSAISAAPQPAPQAAFAPPSPPAWPMMRPRLGRKVAGVCLALALRFGIDTTLVRVIFVLCTLLTWGTCVLLYAVCWIVIPDEPYALPQTAGAGSFGPANAPPRDASMTPHESTPA